MNVFSQTIVALLAPGFEEGSIIYCTDRLRDAGFRVSLVGLSAGIMNGIHGIAIQPDYSLEQLPAESIIALVVVPGGRLCASALFADPRVHRLLARVESQQGKVAVLSSGERPLTPAGLSFLSDSSQILFQGSENIHRFASYLVQMLQTNALSLL
ncbi:MAG: DJ-1/PfpI family protein [Chloroflexota bacterium]